MKFLKVEIFYNWYTKERLDPHEIRLINVAHIIDITRPEYMAAKDRWVFYLGTTEICDEDTYTHILSGNENTEESCMEKYNEIVSKMDVI